MARDLVVDSAGRRGVASESSLGMAVSADGRVDRLDDGGLDVLVGATIPTRFRATVAPLLGDLRTRGSSLHRLLDVVALRRHVRRRHQRYE